jgi:hypothetical protein
LATLDPAAAPKPMIGPPAAAEGVAVSALMLHEEQRGYTIRLPVKIILTLPSIEACRRVLAIARIKIAGYGR